MDRLPQFLRSNAPWLAAGFLLSFASSFGQTFFIAVFAGEIRSEFGLTHGAWGGIYLAGDDGLRRRHGLCRRGHRPVPRALDRRRRLRRACRRRAGHGLGHHRLDARLAVFLLRLLGQGMMSHTALTAMARWFVATRGRAVSIAGLGVAAGEALLPLGFVALLGVFDWRYLWVGVAVALVALAPLLWRLLKLERTPQSFAAEGGSSGMDGRMWTRGEMLRHWLFWAMLPAMLGPRCVEHRLLLPPGAYRGGDRLGASGARGAVPALHCCVGRHDAGFRLGGGPVGDRADRGRVSPSRSRRLHGRGARWRRRDRRAWPRLHRADCGRQPDDERRLLGRALRNSRISARSARRPGR
jgi:hypothetical protein